MVWHLDVGSSHPGAGGGPKGSAVRRLKWHASWVQKMCIRDRARAPALQAGGHRFESDILHFNYFKRQLFNILSGGGETSREKIGNKNKIKYKP